MDRIIGEKTLRKEVSWVFDADIHGFFGNVSPE